MLIILYKYILSLLVDFTLCTLHKIYSILKYILKINVGVLEKFTGLNPLLTKEMGSPSPPPSPILLLRNCSGSVVDQGTLCGFSNLIYHQCRLPLLMNPTWVTSTIVSSPQPYGQYWYSGGDNFYPPSPPHPYLYHSYLSLFLYHLTQFILSLNLYLSLLSIAISLLTNLISYYISSPLLFRPILSSHLPEINVGLLGCRRLSHGIGVGWGWWFDDDNIAYSRKNTAHANLTPILFLCSMLSLMDNNNTWVWSLPLLVGPPFTPLPSYFLPLYLYIWILKI